MRPSASVAISSAGRSGTTAVPVPGSLVPIAAVTPPTVRSALPRAPSCGWFSEPALASCCSASDAASAGAVVEADAQRLAEIVSAPPATVGNHSSVTVFIEPIAPFSASDQSEGVDVGERSANSR